MSAFAFITAADAGVFKATAAGLGLCEEDEATHVPDSKEGRSAAASPY